jgi:hypothetical protein
MTSPGRKKVIETPEFEEAVNARVKAAMEQFKAEMFAAVTPAPEGAPAEPPAGLAVSTNAVDLLEQVLSKLSMNMAAIGQQGQHRKPLSPEEVAAREAAAERMDKLLTAAHQEGATRPEYKLISKVYLNERFIEPYRLVDKVAVSVEIFYTGVPNDAMVPINDVAKAIFAAWKATTGGHSVFVPTADTRPLWVTAKGLVVKGDPPKRQHVAAEPNFSDDLGIVGVNDHTQAEVAVLGTVARKAITNAPKGVS